MLDKRLKILRKEHDLKQSEVAEKLDIALTTYSNYEQGTRTPDYHMLIKLSDFFGCSIDYLIGRTNNRQEVLRTPSPGEALVVLAKDADVSEEELRKYIEYLKFRKNNPG